MTVAAYYNEIDPYAAQWIRNLIRAGHIAPGIVDERSIEDVHPYDLTEFTQCHFFAGVGVWSLALRLARWPDSRPVWTASCPCQPFSTAGKGEGFTDERHLWPALFHLVDFHRPASIFGEQVASKDANPWIDLVQADMEVVDYSFGAVPFPSASIGAPHIRDRLYWVAYNNDSGLAARREGRSTVGYGTTAQPDCRTGGLDDGRSFGWNAGRDADRGNDGQQLGAAGEIQPVGVGDADYEGLEGFWLRHQGSVGYGEGTVRPVAASSQLGGLANAHGGRISEARRGEIGRIGQPGVGQEAGIPGPTNGFWRDSDWLGCRDGKFRPVEPGTFPLADGPAARVGRLRAYGNAINARQAQIFIEIAAECMP